MSLTGQHEEMRIYDVDSDTQHHPQLAAVLPKASGRSRRNSDDRAGVGLDVVVMWGSGQGKLDLFFLGLLRCGSDASSDLPVLC